MTREEIIKVAQETLELINDERINLALDKLQGLDSEDRSYVIFVILFAISTQLNNHPLLKF